MKMGDQGLPPRCCLPGRGNLCCSGVDASDGSWMALPRGVGRELESSLQAQLVSAGTSDVSMAGDTAGRSSHEPPQRDPPRRLPARQTCPHHGWGLWANPWEGAESRLCAPRPVPVPGPRPVPEGVGREA